MEYTQVLVSESFDIKNTATEKIPVATLLIEDEYHTIYNTENVIGREKTCDIVISNNAVSSKHAVIEAEDSDAHLIYDLGSTNKTKLGKMVLKPHVRYHINDGDSVTFGNVSAQYNISRKYLTTPVKGNTTLNSCSIPETPERLVSTLELDATESTKQKVESSALELSDTDLFDEKEVDTNLYLKEIPSSPSKPSNDIYELDTLSFDEHIENHVKKTDHLEDLNKINVIPANNDVEEKGFDIDPQELGHDEKPVSKSPPMHDKDKTKTNFGWEDVPEITSHVELDSSSANNLVHSKSKVSSSFLDITNDDLKPDQHIPKNIGGVILSDLCKPACIDSDKQDVSSTSKDGELKIVDETEKELLSEKTYIEPKTPGIGGTKDSLYLENDCYIPMSQNIDMFEESPEKTDERPEQGDVYEMLTQVSIENKEVNNSIYDIQTQMVIADNESKVDKENESISITSPNTKLSMLLESASQPAENNDKEEMNNTSYLKTKVIDETDNNCSFSESIYEAETQPFLQKVSKEPISEISNCLPERMDKNGSVTSAIVVTTQPCIHGSLEIQDSTSSEINNKADEKENLSTTIIGRTTQLCPVEISIDPSKQSHSPKAVVNVDDTEIKISSSSSSVVGAGTKPTSLVNQQLLHEDIESNSSEKISAKDLSICDWYEIATQPCQPTSENVLIEKEIQKNELTKNDDLTDDVFIKEAMQDDKFSTSMYEIATQPCPKDILSENNESINETTLNPELTSMRDDNNTNNNFSNSICEIATQPCPKDIFPEKSETTLSPEFTMGDESNKNNLFSTSICEIATQPCPKEIFPKKRESIDNETTPGSELKTMSEESNKNNIFSTSLCEIGTQPCSKDIFPEKAGSNNDTILNSELTIITDENNKNSSFSNSICEIATQPYLKDIYPEKAESIDAKVSDESNKNDIFSNSICEIATQPCPKDIFPEKVESINDTTLNSELTIITDENNKNKIFSDSICEIATQPCPKDIFPEKSEKINETTLNSEITTMGDESNKNNFFSTSICEIATQPCPKDIFPEKVESFNVTTLNPELTTITDEINKNNIFSDSICEIATQPCPKDIFPEKNNETTLNSEITTMGDESNKNNFFSTSICELATQPCPKDIFPGKAESDNEKTLSPQSKTVNYENINNSSFSISICEIATQPCSLDSKGITNQYESIEKGACDKMNVKETVALQVGNEIEMAIDPKIVNSKNLLPPEIIHELDTLPLLHAETTPNIFNKSIKVDKKSANDYSEGESVNLLSVDKTKQPVITELIVNQKEIMPILDISANQFQPAPCQVDSNLPSNEENLSLITKVLATSCEVEKVLVEASESDINIYKAKNILVTTKANDFSLTATLPNALSDSFFEAATQPYKNDQGQDRTFPDPLTSICNDLSDDKIGEITDELMYGNISTKLEDNNKILDNNNPTKERNKPRKNVETSDDNIFEALTDQDSFCSQKKILLNKINTENPPEKISTQDLQRILESDDIIQKYDEFKKTDATSTASDPVLNRGNNVPQDDGNEDLLKLGTKELCNEPVPDLHILGSNVVCIDSDSSQELNIRSNKKRSNVFPPDSQSFSNKFLDNEDSSQELNIKSNKKRCNIFPPDSQSFTYKFLDNEDSSQELNIRSNKKRSNVFPPDSQSFTDKFLDNEDSSQELNIKSNKNRCNVFPPDSQSFTNKFLDNEDSSQEINTISNKKRCNVFPLDSQDSSYKNLESASNVSEEECIKIVGKDSVLESTKSSGFLNKINNDIQKSNKDDSSEIVKNTSVENDDEADIKMGLKKLDTTTSNQNKVLKEKLNERISTSGKRNNKENKNKSPPERERESTYISRGNITLHSPEVLSELEEQFRLTKVAMSPTQLSVVSDIESEINSSQEVDELDKQGIRRSIRNRKNTVSVKSLKNTKSPILHKMIEPPIVTSNENLLKENESKRKDSNSSSTTSKGEKSFKRFKKVSPVKNNTPTNEKLVKVTTNEGYVEIANNYSDNSQNSEELGRGKRKRTRPSYEGFIIEEEKKRTSRKKLSFSNSDDSENMSNVAANIEEINNSVPDESVKKQNDVPSDSIKKHVSVVLDIQKVPKEVPELNVEKSRVSKKKPSKKNETSPVLVDKISNVPNSSMKDEAKAKQNETSSKDKNCSFSFSEKLDELFNIWGPADRVKLSPRGAKKSYKLLAEGKTESVSPTTSGCKSQTSNSFAKEPKPSTSKSNKNSIKADEKKNEPICVVETKPVITSRKRNLSQKSEVVELSDAALKQSKKRRKTNSENSETSQEADTNDSEVRKSSRIMRKKTPDILLADCKHEKNPGQTNRTSNELQKRVGNRSTESTEDSTSVSNKNIKTSLRNSRNISMKPPLSTVIVNVKNKNSKTKEKKTPIHIKENSSPEIIEENYCFSQEYSFHENKIKKGRKKPSENCSNLPLKIRRSSRKKNEKTAERNVENVMFTGFADKKTRSLVNVLGGQIVESPFTCTVLVTDKVRRTTKFLSALSRGLPIVSPQWLIDSNENGRFLDSSDFLLSDNEAEKMFSFNLKNSIEKAQNGKVLDGWAIFVTPSVKPSPEEMKSIIECSGGRFLSKELTRWPINSIIVSCDEDRTMWPKFSKKGKAPVIVNNEAILLGILRQELDIESHKLL